LAWWTQTPAPSRRAEGLGRVVVKSTAITVKITAIQELKEKEDGN